MVGPNGLEPSTSSVSRKRSNQLSYGPATGQISFYGEFRVLQNESADPRDIHRFWAEFLGPPRHPVTCFKFKFVSARHSPLSHFEGNRR
jgi:hypothetical protein